MNLFFAGWGIGIGFMCLCQQDFELAVLNIGIGILNLAVSFI